MAKFIDLTEIYGNCFTNNQSKIHGKIYNDDLLYVSFSQAGDNINRDVTIHVRRFDGSLTTSGVPIVHWWISYSGSDASDNQGPISPGGGFAVMSMTTGYMLDPTVNTTITTGATLWTSIVNSSTHNATVSFVGGDLSNIYTHYINAKVQGIVYSEKFTYEN